MMLYLGWIFLWLVSRERIKGFNISDCSTKRLIWTYQAWSEEEFILFCDLPEPQKSCFFHRHQLWPTQVPELVPCSKDLSSVQWYLQPQNGDPIQEVTRYHPWIKNALHFPTIQVKDAGSYICRYRIRSPQDDACCIEMVLDVKPKKNKSILSFEHKHKQFLLLGSIDPIYCPNLHCQSDTECPEVTWYQDGKLLTKKGNPLQVGEVYNYHRGTYVCDYTQSNNSSLWIVRAVVQVETVVKNTNFKPDILEPDKDTLEVELGKPLTLNCKVRFGFEKNLRPVVKWYVQNADQEQEVPVPEGNSNTSMVKDGIIQQHVLSLKEVTQSDLQRKFICFAKNSVGSTIRSIQLNKKKEVVFIYILLGTIMSLVGVLLVSALLYTYWIETVLLYRTYQSKDETLGDRKEFDAFVSYAKLSSLESEVTSSLSEESLALSLFPEVLENRYGYTLCLLDRDVAPGGVYAEDIVNIIKKSRRGIFILSPNYVNGPSVFELQAAVNLALEDRTLKLILIKFCSFKEPECLPHLVKKALSVLPTITWRGLKSVPPNSRFWTQVRYHMPVRNSKGLTWNHLRIIPECFHWKGLSKSETTRRSSQPREW